MSSLTAAPAGEVKILVTFGEQLAMGAELDAASK